MGEILNDVYFVAVPAQQLLPAYADLFRDEAAILAPVVETSTRKIVIGEFNRDITDHGIVIDSLPRVELERVPAHIGREMSGVWRDRLDSQGYIEFNGGGWMLIGIVGSEREVLFAREYWIRCGDEYSKSPVLDLSTWDVVASHPRG